MRQYDSDRWYVVVLGDETTYKYFGCRYVVAVSTDDAKEKAKFDVSGNLFPKNIVALQVIFMNNVQPTTVFQKLGK